MVRTCREGVEGTYFQAKMMTFRNPLSFEVVVDIENLRKLRHLIELYGDMFEVVRKPYEGNSRFLRNHSWRLFVLVYFVQSRKL